MKKLLFTVLSVCFCLALYSQRMVLHDPVSARVFNSTKYSDISGSPFLRGDQWIKGSVITNQGMYQNLELKLDAYSNILHFNKEDKMYEFEDYVKAFILMPNPSDSSTYQYYQKGLSGNGVRADQFLQVLSEGKTGLYKLETKMLSEINQINQGVVKSFTNATRYYILKDGTLEQIRLTKAEVLGATSDKKDLVQAFIESNNISWRKDTDVAKIFRYYNSLVK
jgi:hypothetical protein